MPHKCSPICHNPLCHQIEWERVRSYLEIILVVRLDGDEPMIDSILDALGEAMDEAA